ncbi:MAG: leucine-rich repeat protein [Clostridia bacterium]|nr:leucine-rich repeat protein [Clostridia bacterium]
MIASACMLFGGDGAMLQNSVVTQSGLDIDTNKEQYLNSSVMYKLPDTVKDTDDISIIIRTQSTSLLDAYDAGDMDMSFPEYAYSDEADRVAAGILDEKKEILSSVDGAKIDYTLGADYKAIFGGFEVVIKAADFESLCKAVGNRATVIVGEEYKPCETQLVENAVNVYETGIFNSSSFGYDGTGTIVAVLDTGLDYNHTAFSVNNFTADRNKLGLTYAEVEGLISDTKASKLHAGLTAADVYLNEKVPFAFDYADGDPDVYPMTPSAAEHGTHVAGVIAGKDDVITGVAPNAQLAIMKIFSDVLSTARTSWILSALEDCVIVGVDVINMSIGTSCGFSREMDKEAITGVYDRIRETGISMVVAASNSFNSTYGSEKNGNLGLTSNPDSATVGSPSTYEGAMSVASISGTKTPYLLYNDTIIYFTESTDRVAEEKNFYDDILPEGQNELEIEYVTVPGAGRSADYSGLDVAGKIVLVRRGATTFEEKANVAQSKGAAGIIIYNNVSGDIKMNVGDATLGVCSIGQDDGELLAAAGSGTLKLSRSQTSGPFMSDFSSWGPTPDLGIKPEITAHGGMIYSAVPGQSYDRQSGTSMACPNIAGVTALIRQYVVENFPEIAKDNVKVTAFVNQLMMSTADIVYNTNGLPYAVRKQGAGLANLDNVGKTTAYIITYKDGEEMDKSKLELGDDPKKTGVYELSFTVKNFGKTSLSYDISAIVMTEGVSETKTQQGETTVDELGRILDGADVRINGSSVSGTVVTVGAGQSADVTVTITLSDADKKYLDDSFENGMYVEGFIVLDAADESVVDLSVPYLAFYGDWTEAPLFDLDFYATNKDELDDSIDLLDKTLPDAYATRPIGSVQDDYVSFLGSFYFVQDPTTTQIAADRKYISLSNQEGAVHELSNVWAGLLRNAAKIVITITDDATGEVVFEKVETDVRKSYGDGGSIYPADVEIGFDAYEENLKNNTKYTVKLQGYLDYGDGGIDTNDNNVFEFPLTTDFSAPAVTDCEFYTEYDRNEEKTRLFAKIAVYDNHYSMALQVGYVRQDSDGYMLDTFDQYLTPIYSEENSVTYVVYELTDYVDDIRRGAVNKNSFTVATYDYALNTATYEIQLPDDFESFYFEEESLTLSPNQVHTLKPLSYPDTEWTELLEYTSTNTKVAHIVNDKVVTTAPGQTVIIARDPSSGRQALLNLTVLGEGDEGYVKYDKPVTDDFVLTGYLTNKAYYFLSSDEREIGSTGDEMKFVGNNYSLSMYPSESVTLRYRLEAYFPEDTEIVAASSNDNLVKVEKVNGEWVITAQAEGYASVSVDVLMDGATTFYSQSISIEVKDPYITTGPSLTHYFGLGGRVEIPESLAITDIGQFAFANFDYVLKGEGDEISEDDPTATKQWFIGENTITEVVIPEGVKTIGSYAFANLTALEKVYLPKSLERIDFGAFYGCTSLTQVVGIENVKFINRSAFENCALKDKIDLKSTVAIADRAFAGNTRLDEVILGENVQSVGAYAFAGDIGLEKVTVKAELIKLGQYAFDRCESLKEIYVNATVIPTAAFNECKSLETISLGKDVAVISEYAFSNASAKKFTVDAKNTVFASSTTGEYLTNKAGTEILLLAPGVSGSITINNSNITGVGSGAFSGNANIVSVTIPSVTSVSSYAFAYSEKLASINLGKLTYIGDHAFYRTAIDTVPSLEGVSSIGDYAFAYTNVTSLTVPANMTVGEGAFRECKALHTVVIGDGAKIGSDAFRLDRETNFTEDPGTYRDENDRLVYYYIYTSALHSLTVGNNVTIGNAAFMGAAELETVTLGEGAVIGDSAFYNAASLKSIDLTNVKSIGSSAFSGDVLYEFADQNLSEPKVDENREYVYRYYAPAFSEIDLTGVETIGEDAFAYCRSLVSVKLGDSIVEIPARAFNLCEKRSNIDLSAISTVGENAFCETALKNIDLSSAIQVDKFAFVYNEELESVTFANAVELGEGALSYCDKLREVKGSANIAVVGDYAFAYTAVSSIDLSGASSIGDCAFLKEEMTDFSVKLGSRLAEIGENPFALCRLKSFETTKSETFNGETFTEVTNTYDISESVKIIDGHIYKKVPAGLEFVAYTGESDTVTVAEGTARISAQAFSGAPVKHVVLPSTLESIGHKAFFGCDRLTTVSFTSYHAPVLEEEYDYSYWLSGENIPATGDYQYLDSYTGETLTYSGLGIVPYFMWNAAETPSVIYYGASFVDYVGRAEGDVAMIKPSNGIGYDSFVMSKYFGLVIEGAAAADETTLAAIDAIDAIPETVTLADKDTVLAARAAYDKISSYVQRALVSNYDKLMAAEQRISDLEFIQNGEGETETDGESSDPTNKPVDMMTVIVIVICAGFVILIAIIIVLTVLYFGSKRRVRVLSGEKTKRDEKREMKKEAKKAKKQKKAEKTETEAEEATGSDEKAYNADESASADPENAENEENNDEEAESGENEE